MNREYKGCSETDEVNTHLSEPKQVFYYSPVKYVDQALGRMLAGLRRPRYSIDHLPLSPLGPPDVERLYEWRNTIHVPGREATNKLLTELKEKGFWNGVNLRPV